MRKATIVTTRFTALVAALAVGIAGLALAAPAQARPGYTMTLVSNGTSAGGIGIGRMDGSTFTQQPGFASKTTGTYPDGSSLRSVQTGRGWCVRESSWYSNNNRWIPMSEVVHTYTTQNGGYRTLAAAALGERQNGFYTTYTSLRLYRC